MPLEDMARFLERLAGEAREIIVECVTYGVAACAFAGGSSDGPEPGERFFKSLFPIEDVGAIRSEVVVSTAKPLREVGAFLWGIPAILR